MRRPRLLLADNQTLVVEGLKRILEPEFDLVGTAENGHVLLATAERLRPDAILLEIFMPLLNGIDAVRRLRKIVPRAKIVFVTMHGDTAYIAAAFRAGASGYVLKRSAVKDLICAIREVLQGRLYITPLAGKNLLAPFLAAPALSAGELTARQREVLQLIAEGRSRKESASILGISVKTVEFHKARISRTLGIRTVAGMTRYAFEHGLIGQ